MLYQKILRMLVKKPLVNKIATDLAVRFVRIPTQKKKGLRNFEKYLLRTRILRIELIS